MAIYETLTEQGRQLYNDIATQMFGETRSSTQCGQPIYFDNQGFLIPTEDLVYEQMRILNNKK